MNKITAKTLVLIAKAKEISKINKIKQKKKQADDLEQALTYIHEHLDIWYQEHINDMANRIEITDPYNFKVYCAPGWCLSKLCESKKYKYGCYCFYLTNCSIFNKEYLAVKVRG